MGVGSGLYMYDVVVKRSRSLSHLLMSSCLDIVRITRQTHRQAPVKTLPRDCLRRGYKENREIFSAFYFAAGQFVFIYCLLVAGVCYKHCGFSFRSNRIVAMPSSLICV